MAAALRLLLLLGAPVAQCSPHMLNGGHAQQHEAQEHRPHHVHQAWQDLAVAETPLEALREKEEDARIFERGRRLRERKAEFYRLLATCKQGDTDCDRRVIAEKLRQERIRAQTAREGTSSLPSGQVTDALGRSMPLLFGGRLQSSAYRAAGRLALAALVSAAGLAAPALV